MMTPEEWRERLTGERGLDSERLQSQHDDLREQSRIILDLHRQLTEAREQLAKAESDPNIKVPFGNLRAFGERLQTAEARAATLTAKLAEVEKRIELERDGNSILLSNLKAIRIILELPAEPVYSCEIPDKLRQKLALSAAREAEPKSAGPMCFDTLMKRRKRLRTALDALKRPVLAASTEQTKLDILSLPVKEGINFDVEDAKAGGAGEVKL